MRYGFQCVGPLKLVVRVPDVEGHDGSSGMGIKVCKRCFVHGFSAATAPKRMFMGCKHRGDPRPEGAGFGLVDQAPQHNPESEGPHLVSLRPVTCQHPRRCQGADDVPRHSPQSQAEAKLLELMPWLLVLWHP